MAVVSKVKVNVYLGAASGGAGAMTGSLETGKSIANNSGTVATITSVSNVGSGIAGALGKGTSSSVLAVGATVAKVGDGVVNNNQSLGDSINGLSVGDVLGTAAAVAALAGAAPLALGLTVAGLGYTVWSLTSNNGQDVSLGDLFKLHPDNFREDKWGNPDNFLGDYKDKANRDGKYHVRDPLILDLDGDGIETVGTQGYRGALFDHNKDGIRTATGWVSADDGLLVIDRNSDGLINNGNELFGDSTALKDGNNAEHGYAALKEFDTNSDGLIDAQDEAFKQLRVWRDLNQDGISQEGELFTLESLNIQSLNTAYQDVDTRLGNGNSLVQKGSYVLSDGQMVKSLV